MKYKKILNKIQSETGLESPQERREILITAMRENERKGNDCLKCSGRCCTYEANSMNMTNLEALEALTFLEDEGLINDELIERLENSVKEFRLDSMLQIGKGEFYRKSYTCPFFNFPTWGCGLGAKNKPYGCIAFNPHESGQENGGNCNSNLEIQMKRLFFHEDKEREASSLIAEQFKIADDKSSIPMKLLELLNSKVI